MKVETSLRDRLNMLSKELFGAESKWMSFVKKGVTETVTIDTVVDVKNEDGTGTTRTDKQPVIHGNGSVLLTTKWYSPEQIAVKLEELKVQKDEFLAKLKAQEDLAKEKATSDKLKSQVMSSTEGSVG